MKGPTRNMLVRASDYNRHINALKLYCKVHPDRKGYKQLLDQWRSMK